MNGTFTALVIGAKSFDRVVRQLRIDLRIDRHRGRGREQQRVARPAAISRPASAPMIVLAPPRLSMTTC
jgi:hypothetical protein